MNHHKSPVLGYFNTVVPGKSADRKGYFKIKLTPATLAGLSLKISSSLEEDTAF